MHDPPLEIERKFLVRGEGWREGARAVEIRQGYLASGPAGVVRVRRQGDVGLLTVKGKRRGLTRVELEYEIPARDAEALLEMCDGHLVSKTRHSVEHAGKEWVVDVFSAANEGLIVAEIELDSEDEAFERPDWVGAEVSTDARYSNGYLSRHPYSEWR